MNIGIKDVLYKIRLFFIPYLVVLCACLIIKLVYLKETIFFAVNSFHNSFTDTIAPYITDIGDGLTIIILSAILVLFSYRKAYLLITSYAITSILAQVIKHIFDAPRPKLFFKDKLSTVYFVKGVYILSMNSFPSGHTVTAFSAAVVFTYLAKNKNWGFFALLIAILVGYSRMYLSEHFFEDVIAGSTIGTVVTVLWISWIDNKQFLHSSKWNRGLLNRF